jgi:hypothetical protein
MSCITEILAKKGDQEYLMGDGFVIEDGGTYKEYEYLVTFIDLGHRCGYVAINSKNKFYGLDLVCHSAGTDFDVHGGISFHHKGDHIIEPILGKSECSDEWIGFDAAHGADLPDYDLVMKIWPSERRKNFIDATQFLRNFYYESIEHRSKEYMIAECKSLIDQIIEGNK